MLDEIGFNEWAKRYDESVKDTDDFPFAGYQNILGTMIEEMKIEEGTTICDVGIGTGILASYLNRLGAKITGIDFSDKMLEIAKSRIKDGVLIKRKIEKGFLGDEKYQYIVSSYVMHHFTLEEKVELLKEMKAHLLPGGKVIIGDIAFTTQDELEKCAGKDEDEIYFVKDEIIGALRNVGIEISYKQISFCAAVMVIDAD